MWPSLEIWDAPSGLNGLVTEATWCNGASSAASSAVRAMLAGSAKAPLVMTTTWAGLPGEVREVGVQDLLGRLGTARQVVGEGAARGLRHDVDAHQADDPGDQDPPSVVVAPAGQPGQGALLGGAATWARDRTSTRGVARWWSLHASAGEGCAGRVVSIAPVLPAGGGRAGHASPSRRSFVAVRMLRCAPPAQRWSTGILIQPNPFD